MRITMLLRKERMSRKTTSNQKTSAPSYPDENQYYSETKDEEYDNDENKPTQSTGAVTQF